MVDPLTLYGIGFLVNSIINGLNSNWQRNLQESENEKQRNLQEKLHQFSIDSQVQLAAENRNYQIEIAQKQRDLQKELTHFTVMANRETTIKSFNQKKIIENFPITLAPEEYVNFYSNQPNSLFVVLIPPRVDESSYKDKLKGQEDLIYKDIREYLNEKYTQNGEKLLFVLSGSEWNKGGWQDGDDGFIRLNNELKALPFLVIETMIIQSNFSLRGTYWNSGGNFSTHSIINSLPLEAMLKSFQKQRLDGQINDGSEYLDLTKSISSLITITISLFADAHLQLNGVIDEPILPINFATLLLQLPKDDPKNNERKRIAEWVLQEYQTIIDYESITDQFVNNQKPDSFLSVFSPNKILSINTNLSLANSMYKIGYYKFAEELINNAILHWRQLHGFELDEEWKNINTQSFINRYHSIFDNNFFNSFVPIIINAETNHVPSDAFKLLSIWSNCKSNKLI